MNKKVLQKFMLLNTFIGNIHQKMFRDLNERVTRLKALV